MLQDTQDSSHDLSSQTSTETRQPVRGKLKVFLGYAAGVGKTYAMLEAACQRQKEGVDVVVGYADTHDQPETERLLQDLEIVPPKQIEQNNTIQTEMDLDAVLLRKPKLVLVDNLAHTNGPGSRHAKRYQDVEELLTANIDVYATVNIEHLESLNDVVVQITGVRVKETVPDRVLDMVDSIELIDLPPDELIRRLQEGRVHVPDQTMPEMQKFFRPGNLAALREMALRHAAAQVDDQMRAYKETHAIFQPWAATDRLLVCISANPLSERLVRTGRRLASQLNVEWFVLYVETSRHTFMSETERERVAHTMRLAEELGAKAVSIPGQNVSDAILEYARSHNVTKIIVGKSLGPGWGALLRHRSIVDQIIHQSEDIDVYVISATVKNPQPALPSMSGPESRTWRHYVYSVILVALVSLVGQPVRLVIEPTNLVMLYLLAVVIAAIRWGRGPSILAAILSVLTFDFFMVPPHLTFVVSDAQYILTFLGLLAVGIVISTLAVREREQAEAARRREMHTAALYDLSRDLATSVNLEAIARVAMQHIGDLFRAETALFLPEDDGLDLYACSPQFVITKDEQAASVWVFRQGQKAGHGTGTMATTKATYFPLKTAQGTLGVVGVALGDHDITLNPEQHRLLEALLSQVALATEATQLAENARQAQLLRETEKLQTALLNSISHDLRTPLSSITGALSSLRDDDQVLDNAARHDLIDTAWEESDRLNRLVANLLNMSRLEAGAMKLALDVCDVEDLVGVALNQMSNRLRGRQVEMNVPGDLPPLNIDLVLVAQALVNLIDNAVKYSHPSSPITICAYQDDQMVAVEVSDRGSGIPETELEHIFDKFHRVTRMTDTSGTGLGLSISKGIVVDLHGGRVWAANRSGGGATVTMALPIAQTDEIQENE